MSTVEDLKVKLAELGGAGRLEKAMKDFSLTRDQIREGGLHIHRQASNNKWMVSVEPVANAEKAKPRAGQSAPKKPQQQQQQPKQPKQPKEPKADGAAPAYAPLPPFDMEAFKLRLLEIGGAGRLERALKETQFTREQFRGAGLHIWRMDSNQKWMVSLEAPTAEQSSKKTDGGSKGGKGGKGGNGGKGGKGGKGGAGKGFAASGGGGGGNNIQQEMMQMLGGCMQLLMSQQGGGGGQGTQQTWGGQGAGAFWGKGGSGKGKKIAPY